MKKIFLVLAILLSGFLLNAQSPSSTHKSSVEIRKDDDGKKLKKDGTPDRRFKENKKLKKDGSPDMRYKENKTSAAPKK